MNVLQFEFGMHIALSKHPRMEVRSLAIVDDITFLGSIRDTACIYFELKIVLKEIFGINLNLRKSSLLLLQLHTVVDPVSFMEPIYQMLVSCYQKLDSCLLLLRVLGLLECRLETLTL